MTLWLWVAVGAGAYFMLSLVVTVVLASTLGRLHDLEEQIDEDWTCAPLTREMVADRADRSGLPVATARR